jgi:hypothetical protein
MVSTTKLYLFLTQIKFYRKVKLISWLVNIPLTIRWGTRCGTAQALMTPVHKVEVVLKMKIWTTLRAPLRVITRVTPNSPQDKSLRLISRLQGRARRLGSIQNISVISRRTVASCTANTFITLVSQRFSINRSSICVDCSQFHSI